MSKMLCAATAAALAAIAGSTNAATIVGNLSDTGSVLTSASALGMTEPGRWRISWALNTPAENVSAGLMYEVEWDRWNRDGPTPEGNEFYEGVEWAFTQDGASGFFEIDLRRPYRTFDWGAPNGHWDVFQFHPMEFWVAFGGPQTPGAQYELTATFQSAIPEPATWAIMIVGFGAAGSALRFRRRFRPA